MTSDEKKRERLQRILKNLYIELETLERNCPDDSFNLDVQHSKSQIIHDIQLTKYQMTRIDANA